MKKAIQKIIRRIRCKHNDWEIQPTYALLYYDRCKECGKLRETIGAVEGTHFEIGKIRIK